MSRSTKVDVVFGFKTNIELNSEEKNLIHNAGLIPSPLVYTTEDTATSYIIGKPIIEIVQSGSYQPFEFNPTEEEKQQMKNNILEKLSKIGFEVGEKEFKLFINTYFY